LENVGIIGKAALNPQAILLDEAPDDLSCGAASQFSVPQRTGRSTAAGIADDRMSVAQKEWPCEEEFSWLE
jgi:hypothetical protein